MTNHTKIFTAKDTQIQNQSQKKATPSALTHYKSTTARHHTVFTDKHILQESLADGSLFTHEEKKLIVSLYRKKYAELSPGLLEIVKHAKEMQAILEKHEKTPNDKAKLHDSAKKLSDAVNSFNKELIAESKKVSEKSKKIILEEHGTRQIIDIETSFSVGANHTLNNINCLFVSLSALLMGNSNKYESYAKMIRTGVKRTEAVLDLLQNGDESKVAVKEYLQKKDAPLYFVLEPETGN